MKTIRLEIELEYDTDMLVDPEYEKFFFEEVLLEELLLLHSNEIGDMVGEIKKVTLL